MRAFLLLGIALLGSGMAWAQVHIPTPLFATPYVAVSPGSTFYLALVVDILEGWAIPAAHAHVKGLLPTKISVEPAPGLVFGEVLYPQPQKKWLEVAKTYIEVYTGQVSFIIPVRVEKEAPLGLRTIHVRLEYQACEEKVCLLPEVLELAFTVLIFPKPGAATSFPALPQARRASHPPRPPWTLL